MTEQQKSKRLSAAHKFDAAFHLLTRGKQADSDYDSLTTIGSTTKRISRAKAQAIGRSLTNRDRKILELFSAVSMATGAQIRRLVWGEGDSQSRSARRQLAKLTDLRVVARLPHRPGGVRSGHEGFVYRLDVVGQHLTSDRTPRRPRQPNLAFVEHSIAVSECYLVARLLVEAGRLDLLHFESEPFCWRSYFGPGGAPRTLRPDAFVITATGDWEDRWFFEIDRGSESPGRLETKAQNYINYWQSGREQATTDVFPKVLFVVPDDRRLKQVVAVLSELPAEHWRLFQVTDTRGFSDVVLDGAGPGGSEP